ncbi:hypothetical protein QBC40DRAFT_78347 [Triangularia verruculosa]|uniref:Uncharacterized protein n=1 Tax=Triangularia verruculosa TaxID=2587418 RepID=A0AAN6XGN3_9PEZI|nr:hypothetical protein QBC40DRAFT_78347 [Triangularia verruculosa]
MRVTGPGLRRRNHAWLEMRSRERRWTRRQVEEEDDADEDTSDSGGETSGDDSGDEEDVPTVPTVPKPLLPVPTVGAGAGVSLLPPPGGVPAPAPTPAPAPVPGGTLGADDGIDDGVISESDGIDSGDETSPDESATASPSSDSSSSTSTSAIDAPAATMSSTSSSSSSSVSATSTQSTSTQSRSAGPTDTQSSSTSSSARSTSTQSSSTSSTPTIDDILTSITAEPTALPTLALPELSPTPGATGGATSDEEQLGGSPTRMNAGAVAGIVIGTLAIIGCLVGAAFFWRKWRRDRGQPFFPIVALPWKKDRDDNYDSDAALAPPAFQKSGNEKTNTAIMDDLMRAAYEAENGNDMEYYGGSPPDKKEIHPNMIDEKAYVALAGHLTPRTPKKPVSTWLGGIVTPRQSQGPVFPPSPMYSEAERMESERRQIGSTIPGTMAVPKLQPPPPAKARTTMTTDTTNTSVRWYG